MMEPILHGSAGLSSSQNSSTEATQHSFNFFDVEPFLIFFALFTFSFTVKHELDTFLQENPFDGLNGTFSFHYDGICFEFRVVGSSQNFLFVSTVLKTICAQKFGEVADRINDGENSVETPSCRSRRQ